jgi:hypothetical protein
MRPAHDPGVQWGGVLLLAGAVTMLAGAGVHFSEPALGIDGAIERGEISAYLGNVVPIRGKAYANLVLWIVGVGFLGLGGTALSAAGDAARGAARGVARFAYAAGATLAWVSFMVWIALVRAAPTLDPSVAEALAFVASRVDWLATTLIVGVGPAVLSTMMGIEWLPKWLRSWGLLAAGAGVLTWIAMAAGGLESYGFIVVPVGVVWSLVTGILVWRRGAAQTSARTSPNHPASASAAG